MWKKLCSPLSEILYRALPSTSRFYVNSILQMQFSTSFSPLPSFKSELEPMIFPTRRYHFLGKSNICSESSERVLPRCWNCDAVAQRGLFLVCESCRSVQSVDHSVDYFQIFGLGKLFEFEDENLEGKYKDWQKKLHPDLVHSKSEKEKEYAAEQSARVIDAYRTLSNPLSRAIYILKLEGVDVDEEKTVSEPELLTEIMEIREAVEEAADSQALNQIQTQIQDKLKQCSKSFANAFQNRKYEEALTSIQRMTYYNCVNEEIVKKL